MRHIARGGRIDGRHADFGGLGHEQPLAQSTDTATKRPLASRTLSRVGLARVAIDYLDTIGLLGTLSTLVTNMTTPNATPVIRPATRDSRTVMRQFSRRSLVGHLIVTTKRGPNRRGVDIAEE
jgi:hypothetical protein